MKPYPIYKDSGIEWIGKIPEHWIKKKLKFLGKFSSSGIDKKIKKDEPKVKIVNFTDIYKSEKKILDSEIEFMVVSAPEQKIQKNLLEKGDLIFLPSSETKEDLGLSALVNENLENTSFSYHVIRLNFDYNINHAFKKYLTNNNFILNKFSSFGQGTTRQIIGRDIFNNMEVILPPLNEQTQIANYLNKKTTQIDSLIAKKENLIQLLEEEKTALINQAVTKGLDPNVKMKDSGIDWLGEIPEHWEVKRIKFLANLKSGDSITSDRIKETESFPVYGGNGLRGYCESYNNEGNFVLIGRQGALCGNIQYAKNKFWASEHAIVSYLKNDVNWKWFGKLLEAMNLNQYNQSAAQPGLAVGLIKNLHIPFPKVSEQNKIANYIKKEEIRIMKIITKSQQEMELLIEYKTTLISEVVTGKVDVRDKVIE